MSDAFDPDSYLAQKKGQTFEQIPLSPHGFDPDSYLDQKKGGPHHDEVQVHRDVPDSEIGLLGAGARALGGDLNGVLVKGADTADDAVAGGLRGITGGLSALIPGEKEVQEASAKRSPIAHEVGDIAGGAAIPVPGMAKIKAMEGMGGVAARLAAHGGFQAALSGLRAGVEDKPILPAAGAGFAGGVVGQGLGEVVGGLGSKFGSKPLARVADEGERAVQGAAKSYGGEIGAQRRAAKSALQSERIDDFLKGQPGGRSVSAREAAIDEFGKASRAEAKAAPFESPPHQPNYAAIRQGPTDAAIASANGNLKKGAGQLVMGAGKALIPGVGPYLAASSIEKGAGNIAKGLLNRPGAWSKIATLGGAAPAIARAAASGNSQLVAAMLATVQRTNPDLHQQIADTVGAQ